MKMRPDNSVYGRGFIVRTVRIVEHVLVVVAKEVCPFSRNGHDRFLVLFQSTDQERCRDLPDLLQRLEILFHNVSYNPTKQLLSTCADSNFWN
jgi:hypothetical protein